MSASDQATVRPTYCNTRGAAVATVCGLAALVLASAGLRSGRRTGSQCRHRRTTNTVAIGCAV